MEQPITDYYEHPVFHPVTRLQLRTPAMVQLTETIHRWLWTGATGGLILGASRAGKSKALEAIRAQFRTRGGVPIPNYLVSIPIRDQHTILSVFRQLCLAEGLLVKQYDRADHLSDRYVSHIADKAVEHECASAILFVDEMQRLWPLQFNAFAEIYDKLSLLGIAITTVFVGNDQETWRMMENLEKDEYAHIHGRFFTQGAYYHGLTSKDEVKACLAEYDKLRFPEGGPTYTGFFLPSQTARGWKFASLSADLWGVFNEYQRNYKIQSWGMQYFVAVANTLLTDFLPKYGVENVDDDMIRECIRISGLVPSLVRPVK